MTRRCSHCGHNGHNSRTCPDRGIRLFGVRLTDATMRKSASMGNLSHYTGASPTMPGASASSRDASTPEHSESGGGGADGYVSDGMVQTSCSNARERKKGVPWTEEEHRLFLLGLHKLGKGDWRGISRNYVTSRTPTQVASHAQKYFIRQSNLSKRKRRSSLFDISTEAHASMALDEEFCKLSAPLHQLTLGSNASYAPLRPPLAPTGSVTTSTSPAADSMLPSLGKVGSDQTMNRPLSCPTLVKPTATRIDEPCELTKLSLGTSASPAMEASPLTLKLEQPARHSAFHAKASNAASSSISKPISVQVN